ncbi:MAG: hypothetical protein ACI85U_004384 [Candidatus Promineifilaceae bacterium]|jgi:uncharacterized protein (DUF427 family)
MNNQLDNDSLRANREKWTYRGQHRPPFAHEPGPGQESIWDYPRPPALVPDGRLVIVQSVAGMIAETHKAVRICETAGPPTFYIPPADINFDLLVEIAGTSMCEWKGQARYWALPAHVNEVVGWDYPEPFPEFASIAGFLSFYPGRIRCTVDGEIVRPQPGGFYGGWITAEIVGPFKGEPGTQSW